MSQDEYFGSVEAERGLCNLFGAFIVLVSEARLQTKEAGDPVLLAIRPLLFAITDSGRSLALLASKGQLRDGFVTSRTIIETAVNICFILAGAEPVAERAQQHALQKWWRDMEGDMNLVRTEVRRDLSADVPRSPSSNMQHALDQFTHKNGKENTSWTPESVPQRLALIAKHLGEDSVVSLRTALVAIYRHASEVAHGTLYGALFAAGHTKLTNQPQTPAEYQQFYREYFCMLFIVLVGAIRDVLTILSKRLYLGDILVKADKLLADAWHTHWLSKEESALCDEAKSLHS